MVRKRNTTLIIGVFLFLVVLYWFFVFRVPQVHASCSAELQSTIHASSFPNQMLVGKEFTFQLEVTNVWSNGYGPFIDLLFPAWVDQDDWISFISASLQGLALPIHQQVATESGYVAHALLIDENGDPVDVFLNTWEQLVSIALPFWSFVTNQSISIEIVAVLNEKADVNVLLPVKSRGWFTLWCDALNNYSTDTPVVSASRDEQQVNPVAFLVEKFHPASHSPVHAVIWPYHEQNYILRIDVWSWQVLSWINVIDYLPNNIVYWWIVSVSYPWYQLINEPLQDNFPHDAPDNLLHVYIPVLTWTDQSNDLQIIYTYYISDFSTTWQETILSWVSSTTTNEVSVSASWVPIDVRDVEDVFEVTDDHTMINNVMVLRKDSLDFVSWWWFPWWIVEYTLEFDLSDYHQTSGLVIVDTLQDGLRFDESFQPYIEIVDSEWSYSWVLLSWVHYTIDNSDIWYDTNPATSWSQTMIIHISQFMKDAWYDELLQGGEIAPITWTAAGWNIVLRATILDTFTDSYLPWNESVDVWDYLTNTATLYWENISSELSLVNTWYFQQSLSFHIQWSSLVKTIYAINGLTWFTTPVQVSPGDAVTYRVVYSMPSSDAEEIVMVDYLPLPVFSASQFNGFSGDLIGTIPWVWWWTYWPTDTLHTLTWLYLFPWTGSVIPVFSSNVSENTLSLSYPPFNDYENRASVIDILFTVEVTPEPFADNFNITNMVTVWHKTTNSSVTSLWDLVQIVLRQPNLLLTKWVVDTTDVSASLFPTVPVSIGNICPRVTTQVDSSLLDTTPLQSSLLWAEWIQRITYALVVENVWSAEKWVYDIVLKDTIPEWFVIPVSGMNLCIQKWDWEILTFEAVTWVSVVDTDLFWTGIKIIDPPLGSGEWILAWFTWAWWENVLILTYDLETTQTLSSSGVYTNTWVLAHYSSIEWWPTFVSEQIVAQAEVSTESPTFSKSLLSTSVDQTSGGVVVPWEEMVFTLLVEVPDSSTMSWVQIADSLPSWLELLTVDTIIISWSIELATWYTLTGIFDDIIYTPASGGFSIDFWSLVNTDTDLWTIEYILITYTVRVSNQYGWSTNSSLINTATLSWYAQDILHALESTETLTYRLPSLLIQKTGTTTNSNSERFASYTILVQNSSLVPAFDVDLIDELDGKWLEFISWSLTVLWVSWVVMEQWPDLHLSYPLLAPGEFSQLSFQVKVMTGIAYNTGIVNVATGTWSTLSGSSSQERLYSWSASLTTTFSFAPTIAKTLLSTDQSITSSTTVAVGEKMVFRVAVEIPEESPLSWFRITDQLDSWLKFVSVDLLQSSWSISSSLGAITTWVIVPTITSSDTLLTLNFWTIYNDNTNLTTSEYIILEYTVIVDDAVVNTNWLTRRNRARANRYTWPSTQANVEQRRSVVVREPLLTFAKSAPATNTDSDRTITYTLQIANQSANVLTASNLSVSDVLPVHMNFISWTQVSWPVPDTLTFGTSTLIEYAVFPLWQTWVFAITARLDSSITENTSRTNRATGSRTSLPWAVSGERTTTASDDWSTNFIFTLLPNKSLIGSDYGQTSGTQVTVWEEVQYEVMIEVPEDSAFTGVLVVDQLDTWLSWVWLNSLTASWSLTSSIGFGSVVPIVSGQYISFDFGVVTNSDLNTSDTEYIVLQYTVLVDDLPTNISSTNLDRV